MLTQVSHVTLIAAVLLAMGRSLAATYASVVVQTQGSRERGLLTPYGESSLPGCAPTIARIPARAPSHARTTVAR